MTDDKPIKRKVSAGYLERAALHYLGRFASTERNLAKVLERKVMRRNEEGAPPSPEQLGWIADVVAKCVRLGYVNDATYARQRAEALLRKGKPTCQILQDLRFKGVDSDTANAAIQDLSQEDEEGSADARAAAAYVRRRRFGPFRRADRDIEGKRDKELAAMMRAGFGYGLASSTLDASEDELLALL